MNRLAFCSGLALRLLPAACLAALLAGCADSERLSNPFSDPFQGDIDRTPTASIAAPSTPVQSRPLAAPAPYRSARLVPPRDSGGIAGWTAEGGMPIVMAQGESAEIVARRYGIPLAALLRTNGFTSAAQVHPGARLVIPTYNAALAASSGVRFAARAPAHERLRFVRGPQPAHEKLARSKAELKRLAKLKEKKAERSAKLEKLRPAVHEARITKPAVIVRSAPQPKKSAIDITPTSTLEARNDQNDTTVMPEFRWPAHGRIIQCYKCGGNEGINIALPEGTLVKAAEAGVVAYAGDDLKGYGDLILIRHPNGFVTAYANNSEIDVKRGEVVKRGQVIARSGQSGNVASPQLHFELRKGSTPVDPVRYLAGL